MEKQASSILPSLEDRLAALEQELESERKSVAEITACDQEELADLRAGIAEQSVQISGFTAELEDSSAKLDVLLGKLSELEEKKAMFEDRANVARSKCDQFTRSDALRIKGESLFCDGE